jgi:hypothetical protein
MRPFATLYLDIVGAREGTAAFNAARDREYDGLITGCRDAADAVEAMIAAGDFRHGQLSEYDAGLKRLDARRRAIGERDLLGARKAQGAAFAVARYRSALDNYARGVLGGGTGCLLPRRITAEGLAVKRGSPVPARRDLTAEAARRE